MGRVLLGGIVGGILMFLWGFLSHSVLKLSEKSFEELPNEARVVDILRDNVKEPGIYSFPYLDPADEGDKAKTDAWNAKYKKGPNGIIVRGRDGEDAMSMRELGLEFASNVLAAIIAAVVVSAIGMNRAAPSKVVIVTLLGIFAWLSQNASYWIWYRFPESFEVAELVDATAGWFIAGAGIVAIVKTKAAAR